MYFDLRLWRLTEGLRLGMLAGVLLGLAALAAGIARFAFLGIALARVFEGEGLAGAAWPLTGAVVAVLLRGLLDRVRLGMAHHTAAQVQTKLRAALFDRIAALGPAWFAGERTGGVMLSMVDGVEQLQTFFGQYLPQLAIAAVAPLAIFLFIGWWDVPVALVLLVAALATLVLPALVHSWDKRAALARQREFKAFGSEFLDAVQGLPTLQAFGQSASYGARLAEKARALYRTTFKVLGLSVLTRGITDTGMALGAAIALILGAHRVSTGEMSLEALLVVLMAGTEIFRPLRDLRSVLHQGMIGQSAASGVHALLDAQPEVTPGGAALVLKDHAPSIEFDGIRFAYPGGRQPAHDGLAFSIQGGECIGIVGPSGAGKSSILRLLLRQHDAQGGTIRIAGQDLRGIDPASIAAHVAIVAQDATLFHGTIAENLRLGRPAATQEELEAACRAAHAHDFIRALPGGYEAMIGERGARLSGGQRQRLAIARALLRDAPILILDEALSAVDAENEALIQQALDRLMQGRTTLILAHRLSSVIGADRILVLDRGRVAESGTHSELMGQNGIYRQLMGAQDAERGTVAPHPAAPAADRLEAATEEEAGGPVPIELAAEAAAIGWRETLSSLVRYILPWRRMLAAVVAFGIGRVIAFIGVGVLGALLIAALREGQPTMGLAIALLIAAPVAGGLHWLESWLAHDMAYRLLAEMRIDLFARLDRLGPAYLMRRRAGDLVSLATTDVETVEYFYAHTVAPAVVALLVPATVLVVLAVAAWPLALALLPFLVFAGLSPLRGRARIDRLGAEARGALGEIGAHVTETIQGLGDLLAFQAVGRRREAFLARIAAYQQRRLALQHDQSRATAALDVATGLGGLAVAAGGAVLVAQGSLEAGLLPVLILLAIAAFLPVSEIAQVGRQLADTIASTRRLRVVEREQPATTDGHLEPLAPVGGSTVGFEGVDFTYPNRARPALSGLDLAIPAGRTAALVGPSGAGKSTVASLLLRFWDPQAGRVLLDGVDLRDLTLDGLRRHVALVAQDTYLFNDTLEANIRLARPEASAAELAQAIERTALRDFVAALPQGLATPVGERGVQLSGGQRQRIAIARAFLKDAPVLILDEATSHLDAISEAQVRKALDTLMRDRTVLVIAHRLSTIRNADIILVMQAGRLVEAGSHGELLSRQAVYFRLVSRQMEATEQAAQ
ncbi:ABC transporter ATP-binding protein/permease [Roseococcus pinisoli]|uniref:ATP-binding cassette domain-containing protein n=1 Tax=Roseococcus pinisoli TaxID=2835040 RepID=A0ABS5QFT6_9PROT|nr:ATP-binding cassette domain-containing protein [Roseococcus pinisoli]MBS7812562.1 ATP-binding cassette domain-containing protein [Roseococcus pinisoli]